MSLNLRDIDYFLAIARTGSLAEAALACELTQPALSKAVQRLEAEFGMRLFERGPRGVRLSIEGERFHEQALRLQADYESTRALANELRAQRSGLLRVGVNEATAGHFVMPALAALIPDRPGLRIELQMGRSDAVAAAVLAGELDLALVPSYPGRVHDGEVTVVGNDPLLPVARAGHPLLAQARLTLKDLQPWGWLLAGAQSDVHRILSELHARHKLAPPRVIVETSQATEASMQLLASTDLISLVPQSMLRGSVAPRVAVLPIAALQVPRHVVLLSRPGGVWSPLMTALREGLMRERQRARAARTGAGRA